MLLPVEVDLIPEERGCKQNAIWLNGSAGSKIIPTLLIKVVVFHVEPTALDVQALSFKFVSKSTLQSLEERLKEVVHVLLHVSGKVRSYS